MEAPYALQTFALEGENMKRCLKICCIVLVLILGFSTMAAAGADRLYVYSVPETSPKRQVYDENLFAVTLQGIVNRDKPNLYILWFAVDPRYRDVDVEWFRILTQEGNWLSDFELVYIASFDELVRLARDEWGIDKAIIWDTDVHATANVATTLAGIHDAPVLSPELAEKLDFDIVVDLREAIDYRKYYGDKLFDDTYFGKNRVAYQWLLDNYLDEVSKDLAGYCLDGFGRINQAWAVDLGHRDLLVAEKAIVFDLSMWERTDPEDKAMIDRILGALGGRVEVIGFVPWPSKYGSSGWWDMWPKYDSWKDWNPPGVTAPSGISHNLNHYQMSPWSEWELIAVLSSNASYLNAVHWGIWSGNITVHRHYVPDMQKLLQPPPPTKSELIEKGYLQPNGNVAKGTYIMFIMGDMDNYGWIRHWMRPSTYWNDTFRQVYYNWDINPSNLGQIPDIIEYFAETRNHTDYFISSQTGMGYVFPNRLPAEELEWFRDYNLQLFQKMDYKATFAFDRERPRDEVLTAMADIAPDGIYYIVDNSPYSTTRPKDGLYADSTGRRIALVLNVVRGGGIDTNDPRASALAIANTASQHSNKGLGFIVYSLVVGGDKDFYSRLQEELRKFGNYHIVDHRTFAYLYRQAHGESNDNRNTFTKIDVPVEIQAGERVLARLEVRNDGWNDWNGDYALLAVVESRELEVGRKDLGRQVSPRETIFIDLELDFTNLEPGDYTVRFYLTPPASERRGLLAGLFGQKELPFPTRDSHFHEIKILP